jgi:acyl carrier protein
MQPPSPLRDRVLSILEERFEVPRATVTDQSDLRGDLDLDSIDLFDVMGLIEKQFETSVEMRDFIHAKTFGDLIAVLETKTPR